MNVCARMETNGEVDKIHISDELSTKLHNYNIHDINMIQREKIDVKGNGLMQPILICFWRNIKIKLK